MLQNTYSWHLFLNTFAQIKYSNLHKCEDMNQHSFSGACTVWREAKGLSSLIDARN